jgi:CDP-glycerol glycerophosphotransferase (TagB/SpsB family)/glycosyltransferase involved in cell wall biosynthesis
VPAPRFSVIVPVFKVQGFLRACLDSVLGQSFTDLEVIAVDDRSPDRCGAILDEYAAGDDRVKVLHLPENVGLGRARNAGLAHATGTYVLFLDSDDAYTPGILAAVHDRLVATGDPDILVFDHVRTHWWGRSGRSAAADLLEKAGPEGDAGTETFRIREHPEFLKLFLVAWNKAYRRGFYLEHEFGYAPGLYEDAPVTYRAMVTADRIACLDRVGVEYRQRRQGAITRTPGRKHFDIFGQYEKLFAEVDARPELAWSRPLLFERALDHMLFTLARPERVEPADRADFYARMVAFHRSHRPAGFRPPGGLRGAQMRLLATVPYPAYRALWHAQDARDPVREGARRMREALSSRAHARWYATQLRRPLDPRLVLYGSDHLRGMGGDPKAVYEAMRRLAPQLHGVWVVQPEAVGTIPRDVDCVTVGSRRYYELAARASYWINNVNWPGSLVKRSGAVHVHTHLGTPLKHMGADLRDRPGARYGFDVRAMLRRADRWDYSLVASRYAEEMWERAFPCGFRSLHTGSPRNDVLVNGAPERALALRRRLGIPAGNTLVLYAPTPRDYRRGKFTHHLDLERFAAALGPGRTLVLRLHPALAAHPERALLPRDLHRAGVLVDATDEPHVEDLLLAADALVTDYSALMFDYVLLDRPVVLYCDDWDAFRAVRGVYTDITAHPPGHVARTFTELTGLFAPDAGGRTWRDAESARLRTAFRERYCGFEDGRAAERVVRWVLLGHQEEADAIDASDPVGRTPLAWATRPGTAASPGPVARAADAARAAEAGGES